MTIFATYLALFVLTALTIFQIALILKAPLGKYAWGGKHETLPNQLRVASCFSILLYVLFAAFICSKSGVAPIVNNSLVVNIGMWSITIYSLIGIFMNAISRSKAERNLMTPVAAILFATFFIVTTM